MAKDGLSTADFDRLFRELRLLREEVRSLLPSTHTAESEYLAPSDAAALLGVSPKTIHRLISAGKLRKYGWNGMTRVKRSELHEVMRPEDSSGDVDIDRLADEILRKSR